MMNAVLFHSYSSVLVEGVVSKRAETEAEKKGFSSCEEKKEN